MAITNYHMFVYDMPYAVRRSLCSILDANRRWEELAGVHMKYPVDMVQRFGEAKWINQSPTDALLHRWGTQNHTVSELFILLSQMQHYQAMTVLKDLVDPAYHRLIYEGEENMSLFFASLQPNNDTNNVSDEAANKFGAHNFNDPNNAVKRQEKLCKPEDDMIGNPSESSSIMISYEELELATDNWEKKNLLGKGGFGTVFKGFWRNTDVAVKRLEAQKDVGEIDTKQSLRELKFLNSCRHDNILPLYGFSIKGPYDCLVYQYMPNGSLEDLLLCRVPLKQPLSWSQRHNIAVGTARGLQFLHRFGDKPLIHGDIKSANILLDCNMEAKIGDFGLAREGPLQQYTHVKVSRVHGTRPYLPDEFLRAKKFSTKVDTFSFGIVMFELATGLRAYDDTRAYKFLKDEVEASDENVIELRDMKGGVDDTNVFLELIHLGKMCVATKPKDRPEMVAVLEKLIATSQSVASSSGLQNTTQFNNEFLPALDVLAPSQTENESGNIPLLSELGIM